MNLEVHLTVTQLVPMNMAIKKGPYPYTKSITVA